MGPDGARPRGAAGSKEFGSEARRRQLGAERGIHRDGAQHKDRERNGSVQGDRRDHPDQRRQGRAHGEHFLHRIYAKRREGHEHTAAGVSLQRRTGVIVDLDPHGGLRPAPHRDHGRRGDSARSIQAGGQPIFAD